MAKVIRDHFKVESSVCVIHLPSGTKISTYPYKDKKDVGDLKIRNLHDNDHADEYDPDEVRAMALELLKELAEDNND
ncbi:hypothetical protein [Shinella pollutisoli]|uniref:Uncharacterized protein n=1 Tax=Shinella pollutisoli TaxID=2250594 RepID=A0ABV7DJS4_9HYPH|nr:hypothetical protein [Shinella pollutisoli]